MGASYSHLYMVALSALLHLVVDELGPLNIYLSLLLSTRTKTCMHDYFSCLFSLYIILDINRSRWNIISIIFFMLIMINNWSFLKYNIKVWLSTILGIKNSHISIRHKSPSSLHIFAHSIISDKLRRSHPS